MLLDGLFHIARKQKRGGLITIAANPRPDSHLPESRNSVEHDRTDDRKMAACATDAESNSERGSRLVMAAASRKQIGLIGLPADLEAGDWSLKKPIEEY